MLPADSRDDSIAPSTLRRLSLQQALHTFGVVRDHREISPRRLVGFAASLFPIPQCTNGDSVASRKFFLR